MPKKKEAQLELSKSDKKATGLSGGIAEYYQLSPVWVRIVAVIFIVLTGIIPGLIIYFLISAAIKQGESAEGGGKKT
ncbi:PspC domain-containing protein [Candidatus Saccharibacteria bacterium]|nr:PspC domain-containing protein [Candidatus Saccharibacteria bacterium]